MSAVGTNNDGYAGQQSPTDAQSPFNAMSFIINQILGGVCTATLVEVMSVSNAGEVSPVGIVSIRPLVNQVSGNGTATPHGTISNIPYVRIQGGANAVILDPKVGDIGIAVFAQSDISAVKATKKQSNPGSYLRYWWTDGLYIGGVLNGTPTQYVRFSDDGIELVSPNAVKIVAPTTTVQGDLVVTGNTSLGGGAKKVVLDGDPVVGGAVVATSTKTVAT